MPERTQRTPQAISAAVVILWRYFFGLIIPYYGSLDTTGKYPLINGAADTRWNVCDGTDGTPDLRDIPLGASASKTKGTGGGSETHNHAVSVDNTSVTPVGTLNTVAVAISGTTERKSISISGNVGSTTLTVAQMPNHNHILRNGAIGIGTISPMALIEGNANTTPTQYTGGSGSHSHSFRAAEVRYTYIFWK